MDEADQKACEFWESVYVSGNASTYKEGESNATVPKSNYKIC